MRIDTKTSYRRLADRAGFSTVELVTALGLGLVVVGAATAFNHYQLGVLRGQAEQVDLQQTARAMVDLIGREIRLSGANPDCNGAISAVEVATKDRIRIVSDRDEDGAIASAHEDLTYGFASEHDAIVRLDHVQSQANRLAEDLDFTGSRFRYFDGDHNELDPGNSGLDQAQREQIRRVRIEIVLSDSSTSRTSSGQTARAEASMNVDLRNRFFVGRNTFCDPIVQNNITIPGMDGGGESDGDGTTQEEVACLDNGSPCATDSQCCSEDCHPQQGCR